MIHQAERMAEVRSDIRGPLYEEALRMQREGIQVMKLNTGNPGIFGFEMPDGIRRAFFAGLMLVLGTQALSAIVMLAGNHAIVGLYTGDAVVAAAVHASAFQGLRAPDGPAVNRDVEYRHGAARTFAHVCDIDHVVPL